MAYKGKEFEKEKNIYVSMTESLCYTLKLKQHYKSTILQFFKKWKTTRKKWECKKKERKS